MNFIESLQSALSSVRANKMRSFLTMLGIIIGISSVITIISIGQGAKKFMTGEFEDVGANMISIRVNSKKEGIREKDYFDLKDIGLLEKKVDNVSMVSAYIGSWGKVKAERESTNASITGANVNAFKANKFEMMLGRPIAEGDIESERNVAVIDNLAAKKLFKRTDVVGEKLTLTSMDERTISVTIIGVFKSPMEKFGQMFGDQFQVFIPITTAKQLEKSPRIYSLNVNLKDSKRTKETSAAIIKLLEAKHGNKDVYTMENAMNGLDELNKVLNMFTAVIGAIAGISLLVGGIGVMNIMLVSVTERTREIGIRKAIGAKSRDIKLQFLTESVILCLIGGVIGMLLGISFGKIAGHFLKMQVSASPLVILIAVGFSSAVGIFFGIYPASQAAKLDPIEALRYE